MAQCAPCHNCHFPAASHHHGQKTFIIIPNIMNNFFKFLSLYSNVKKWCKIFFKAVYKSLPKFPNEHSALFLMAKFSPSLTSYPFCPISILKEIVQNAFKTSQIYHLPYMSNAQSIPMCIRLVWRLSYHCQSQHTTEWMYHLNFLKS